MNIKKYLQEQVEKDAESLLTESDRQFCMQLAQRVQQPAPKCKKFNFAVISSAVAVCLIALVLGITLPLTLHKQPAVNEILYKEENVTQTACTIEDVNSDSKYFKIEETDGATFRYRLNYDSITGDKLYYTIGVTTEISKFTLDIVINKNYNYSFEIAGSISSEPFSQYNLEYSMQSIGSIMSTELLYKGSINAEAEMVYIDYTQLFAIGDKAFLGDIQSVLKVKE